MLLLKFSDAFSSLCMFIHALFLVLVWIFDSPFNIFCQIQKPCGQATTEVPFVLLRHHYQRVVRPSQRQQESSLEEIKGHVQKPLSTHLRARTTLNTVGSQMNTERSAQAISAPVIRK